MNGYPRPPRIFNINNHKHVWTSLLRHSRESTLAYRLGLHFSHYSWMSLLPWFTAYLSHTSSDPFTSQPLLNQNTKKLVTKHPVSFWGQSFAFVQWVQSKSSVCFDKTMPHSLNSSHVWKLSLFCIHKKHKVRNANVKLQEVSCQLNECTVKRWRPVNDISYRVKQFYCSCQTNCLYC